VSQESDYKCRYSHAPYGRSGKHSVFCIEHDEIVMLCSNAGEAKVAVMDLKDEQADCRSDFL